MKIVDVPHPGTADISCATAPSSCSVSPASCFGTPSLDGPTPRCAADLETMSSKESGAL